MIRSRIAIAITGMTAALYIGSVFLGLRIKHLSYPSDAINNHPGMAWAVRPSISIPNNNMGDSIRRGSLIFDQTPIYASTYTRAKISCSDCHAEGGTQPFASPIVGLPAIFPLYSARAGHKITLKDRIQECFVRSENGRPLAYDGQSMQDLIHYMEWLSAPEPNHLPFQGRGLVSLPDLLPDPLHGRDVYATQCAGCHGNYGQGRAPQFPPLWGPDSFNDGAGMDDIHKMAAFVQHNMPQNRMGILSPQDSFDVSAYIHTQPRPAFDKAYQSF